MNSTENAAKLFPSVFVFLDDNESISLPSLWETILKLLATVDNASSYANLHSHLAPKFVKLLRSACYGNACKIGPIVVPLVNVLRQSSGQKKEDFDRQLVEALCHGLSSRGVANSPMEASAISAVLFQFLEYIVKEDRDFSNVDRMLETLVLLT